MIFHAFARQMFYKKNIKIISDVKSASQNQDVPVTEKQ